jgi:hypothetical protein
MAKACEALHYNEVELVYLKPALDAAPKDANVNRHCARSLARMGQFDQAIACWHRVDEITGKDREAAAMISQLAEERMRKGSRVEQEQRAESRGPGARGAGDVAEMEGVKTGIQLGAVGFGQDWLLAISSGYWNRAKSIERGVRCVRLLLLRFRILNLVVMRRWIVGKSAVSGGARPTSVQRAVRLHCTIRSAHLYHSPRCEFARDDLDGERHDSVIDPCGSDHLEFGPWWNGRGCVGRIEL